MAAGPHRLERLVALIVAGVALAAVSSDAMAAGSRICRQLEVELASGGGRSTALVARQDAAIARQREQLQLARQRARGAGCGFSLLGGGVAKCGAVNAKIERMERNLDALQRKRLALAGGRSGRSRAKIMAALDANGCRGDRMAERRPPRGIDSNANLFDRLFGGGIGELQTLDDPGDYGGEGEEANVRRVPGSREGNWINDDGHIRFAPPAGRYRTLCVRTCDGYFFPMSNASSPLDFERDQKNCQSSCPGTDVQIYYHQTTGEESDDMISLASGAPYADLPAAYLYKQLGTPRPQGCGCGRPNNSGSFAGNLPANQALQTEPLIPTPAGRPDASSKAQRSGGEKVRVVGPTFLPDPAAAIDPPAPAPTEVR